MSDDLPALKAMFNLHGFANTQMWFQTLNYFFEDAEQFFDYIINLPQSQEAIEPFKRDQSIMRQLKILCIEQYELQFG